MSLTTLSGTRRLIGLSFIYDLVADYEKIETALSSRPVSGAQEE